MSTPWAQTTVLSTAALTSTPIALDPLAKMTAVQISFSSSAQTASIVVQATLDTPAFQSGGAGGVLPQPQPIWSQIGPNSSTQLLPTSSNGLVNIDNTLMFVALQPLAGLRISSSTALGAGQTVTLRALQSPAA